MFPKFFCFPSIFFGSFLEEKMQKRLNNQFAERSKSFNNESYF